jgi:hypothetical protein
MADVAREPECVCFARHDTIAEDCELTEKYIGRCIENLNILKHISVIEEKRRAPRDEARVAWLVHPVPKAGTPEQNPPVTGSLCSADRFTLSPRQVHSVPRQVHSVPPTGALCSTPIYVPQSTPVNPKGNPAPLSDTEKIIQDREVKRITKRLEELKDANLQWTIDEKKTLNKELNIARAKLGLTPINQGHNYKKPQGVDRNAGTANEGCSDQYAGVG